MGWDSVSAQKRCGRTKMMTGGVCPQTDVQADVGRPEHAAFPLWRGGTGRWWRLLRGPRVGEPQIRWTTRCYTQFLIETRYGVLYSLQRTIINYNVSSNEDVLSTITYYIKRQVHLYKIHIRQLHTQGSKVKQLHSNSRLLCVAFQRFEVKTFLLFRYALGAHYRSESRA